MSKLFVPLVRASAVVPFVRFLDEVGAASERYLEASKLSPDIVERPEDLVPLRQALTFIERAAVGEGVENLGFLVGERTEITQLGAMGRVIKRSITLSNALTTVAGIINCYSSGDRIFVLFDDDPVLFCHCFVFPDVAEARHANLYTVMLMIKIVRLAMGATWWPREIRLPQAEKARWEDYKKLFPSDVVFHSRDAYAVVLDRPLLIRAMAGTGSVCNSTQDDAVFLRSTAPALDFRGAVRQAIGGLLRSGYPDVRLIADMASLSVRTFQRRLAEDGDSYGRLVEEARFAAAVRLLRDFDLKLIDIAYDLGYSDAANFTRAFKRWAGMPPTEYRHWIRMGAIQGTPISDVQT